MPAAVRREAVRPSVTDETSGEPPLVPARLQRILRRQWWVVILSVAVACGGAVAYVKSRPPSYQAVRSISLPVTASSGGSGGPSVVGPNPVDVADSPSVLAAARAVAPTARISASLSTSGTSMYLTATAPRGAAAVRAVDAAAPAFVTTDRAAISREATGVAAEVTSLGQQLGKLQSQLTGGPTTDRSAVRAQYTVASTQYQQLYTEQLSLQVAAQSLAVGPAVPALSGEIRPSVRRALELAAAIGLVVGAAVALLRDRASDGIRSSSDLAGAASVPLLAQIPEGHEGVIPATVAAGSHDALSEAVRELRTNLGFLRARQTVRVLLVTSPQAGDGKSFVAANLAAAWAAAGQRTVLISSDLRRSGVEAQLGLGSSSPGLSAFLAESAARAEGLDGLSRTQVGPGPDPGVPLDGMLQHPGIPNLSVVAAGPEPASPAELLGSPAMRRLVGQLRDGADLVVLDSPPVLAVTDALVLTGLADAVLLVVARGRTSSRSTALALHMLGRGLAPVVGLVLNRSNEAHLEPSRYYASLRRSRSPGHHGHIAGAVTSPGPSAPADIGSGAPAEPAPRV